MQNHENQETALPENAAAETETAVTAPVETPEIQAAAPEYPPHKTVCQLGADGLFIGTAAADLDPLAGDGSYLLPAGCVDAEPPETREGEIAQWQPESQTWRYLPDLRGQTAFDTESGNAQTIEQIGDLPPHLTLLPPPGKAYRWNGKKWQLNAEAATALRAAAQEQVWEQIKQKRHDNLRLGVYVKSAGKWFHSNDESRTQYLALALLPALPEKLMWKVMDNSFVEMTRPLLNELMLALLADEQADFANAERHRTAMLQAEKPEEYDFSGGWTANYTA